LTLRSVNLPLEARKVPIDLHEAPVGARKLLGQKVHELLILRGGSVFNSYPSRHSVLDLREDEGEDHTS
jgi:hypothetical protein